MKILNRTNNAVRYDVKSSTSADCGTIDPGGSAYLAYRDPADVFLTAKDGSFTEKGVPASGTVTIATSVTD